MEFRSSPGRLWVQDETGRLVAEVTFPEIRPGVAELDHTFVDGSLRGQGVAGQLVLAAAEQLCRRGMKVVPTCPYAVRWFESHPEHQDLVTE